MMKVIDASDDDDEAPLTKPLSDAESAVALSGPALYANRCMVTVSAGGVRIAFVEASETATHFRTAVMLAPQQAISLKEVLTRLLAPIEEQIAAITKDG